MQLRYNAPVTFSFSLICILVMLLDQYVFPGRGACGHMDNMAHALDSISEAAGVRVTSHVCRHWFATVARKAKVRRDHLAALLHHHLNGITDSYGDEFDVEDLRDAIDAIERQWCEYFEIDVPAKGLRAA